MMILNSLKELKIKQYKVITKHTISYEIFLIKNSIDLTRSKEVTHHIVTIYHEHDHNGIRCLGSASAEIYPTMDHNEIVDVLKGLNQSASLVNNPYYKLINDNKNQWTELEESNHVASMDGITAILNTIYEIDTFENISINSSEIFVNFDKVHIVNSNGVNYHYANIQNEVEVVINATNNYQEIEIDTVLQFGKLKKDYLNKLLSESFKQAHDRLDAIKTPAISNVDVVISGEDVVCYFDYYLQLANAENIYHKISNVSVGDSLLDRDSDLLNIQVVKELENSSKNLPIDEDGSDISSFDIYRNSELVNYWGSQQYLQYIGKESNKNGFNFIVGSGSLGRWNLDKPYLEVVNFSSFQMDITTGHFAGEIRLGYYFDGIEKKAVTGGSISGNVNDNKNAFQFSKEVMQFNNYIVPTFIVLKNVKI